MRAERTVLLALFLVPLLLFGLVGGVWIAAQEKPQQPPAEEEPPAEETPPVQVLEPLVIPEEEKNRKNPIEPTEESVKTGRRLFSSQCAMCHGKEGDGKGDLAVEIGLKVLDFTDPEVQEKRTDGELYYILVHGHGRMPGQGERLRPEMKWNIINFIRTLAEPKQQEQKE